MTREMPLGAQAAETEATVGDCPLAVPVFTSEVRTSLSAGLELGHDSGPAMGALVGLKSASPLDPPEDHPMRARQKPAPARCAQSWASQEQEVQE